MRVVPRGDRDEADGRVADRLSRRLPARERRSGPRPRGPTGPLALATARELEAGRLQAGIRIRGREASCADHADGRLPRRPASPLEPGARWAGSALGLGTGARCRAASARHPRAAARTPPAPPRPGPLGDRALRTSTLPGCDEIEERGHVASLGPADVADRVVEPALLVLAVVAARAVGARQRAARAPSRSRRRAAPSSRRRRRRRRGRGRGRAPPRARSGRTELVAAAMTTASQSGRVWQPRQRVARTPRHARPTVERARRARARGRSRPRCSRRPAGSGRRAGRPAPDRSQRRARRGGRRPDVRRAARCCRPWRTPPARS